MPINKQYPLGEESDGNSEMTEVFDNNDDLNNYEAHDDNDCESCDDDHNQLRVCQDMTQSPRFPLFCKSKNIPNRQM